VGNDVFIYVCSVGLSGRAAFGQERTLDLR
jgi:hypothetical protein